MVANRRWLSIELLFQAIGYSMTPLRLIYCRNVPLTCSNQFYWNIYTAISEYDIKTMWLEFFKRGMSIVFLNDVSFISSMNVKQWFYIYSGNLSFHCNACGAWVHLFIVLIILLGNAPNIIQKVRYIEAKADIVRIATE